jgi:hypothetical protein
MHGLINKAVQCFVRDSYGAACWSDVARQSNLGFTDFEAMLTYEDELTDVVIDCACDLLQRPREDLLEDIGTYLVSNPNVEALRRLLRFSGVTFQDFLHSLDELQDRARLAVSDLELPQIDVSEVAQDYYKLTVQGELKGYGHVMVGVLRAMADDYGALAVLEFTGAEAGVETVDIHLLQTDYSSGRDFSLSAGAM